MESENQVYYSLYYKRDYGLGDRGSITDRAGLLSLHQ